MKISNVIKNIIFILISIIGITSSLTAQDQTNRFIDKNNQHSFSAEFLSLSYTYAHQFAPKLRLGTRLQAGFAYYFKPTFRGNDNPDIIDMINFQLLYRIKVSNHFYTDIGTLISYSFIGGTDSFVGGSNNNKKPTYGLAGSFYYNYKKLHLGFSLQYRAFENEYYYYSPSLQTIWESELKTQFLISPLIIGISF